MFYYYFLFFSFFFMFFSCFFILASQLNSDLLKSDPDLSNDYFATNY